LLTWDKLMHSDAAVLNLRNPCGPAERRRTRGAAAFRGPLDGRFGWVGCCTSLLHFSVVGMDPDVVGGPYEIGSSGRITFRGYAKASPPGSDAVDHRCLPRDTCGAPHADHAAAGFGVVLCGGDGCGSGNRTSAPSRKLSPQNRYRLRRAGDLAVLVAL
jgi:hypothetical protein